MPCSSTGLCVWRWGRCQAAQPCAMGSAPARRLAALGCGRDVKHARSGLTFPSACGGAWPPPPNSLVPGERQGSRGPWGPGAGDKGGGWLVETSPAVENTTLEVVGVWIVLRASDGQGTPPSNYIYPSGKPLTVGPSRLSHRPPSASPNTHLEQDRRKFSQHSRCLGTSAS